MDLTRRQATSGGVTKHAGRGPVNTFVHGRTLPDADYKDVVRPRSEGPVVISVPDTKGRYYALSMVDM